MCRNNYITLQNLLPDVGELIRLVVIPEISDPISYYVTYHQINVDKPLCVFSTSDLEAHSKSPSGEARSCT